MACRTHQRSNRNEKMKREMYIFDGICTEVRMLCTRQSRFRSFTTDPFLLSSHKTCCEAPPPFAPKHPLDRRLSDLIELESAVFLVRADRVGLVDLGSVG